jgi:RecB family exonuclease
VIRRPDASGWQRRAAVAAGGRGPRLRREPVLSASEIGDFTFCPQSWYLRRCGLPPAAEVARRLHRGRLRHQDLGRRTDRLDLVPLVQRLLLAAMLAALAALAVLMALARQGA